MPLPSLHSFTAQKMRVQSKCTLHADGATAGGELSCLRMWWNRIVNLGPDYGYLPNASKSRLIVKESELTKLVLYSEEQGVITAGRRRHLGAALGTPAFVESYVSEWVCEMECFSSIVATQPQAAYAALTLSHKPLDLPGQDSFKHYTPVKAVGRCHP